MRVTLTDGRQMTGQMLAFDKHMNLVLADTEEFRRVKRKPTRTATAPGAAAPAMVETEEKRTLGLAIVRGTHIVSCSVDGPPPADPSSRLGASAPGAPGPALAAGPGISRPAGRGLPVGLAGPAPLGGPAPGGFGGFPAGGPPGFGRGGPPRMFLSDRFLGLQLIECSGLRRTSTRLWTTASRISRTTGRWQRLSSTRFR